LRSVLILLVTALLGTALACGGPAAHSVSRQHVFRIGFLGVQTPQAGAALLDDLRAVLNAGGWAEGQNYVLDPRWASGDLTKLPALAAELVQDKPDIIFGGTDDGGVAAHAATSTIPTVSVFCGNPIHEGLVQSLAHPGGNVTGVTTNCISDQLHAKDLQILQQTLPGLRRVGVLWDPGLPDAAAVLAQIQTTARSFGLDVESLEIQTTDDLPTALSTAASAGCDALFITEDAYMVAHEADVATAVVQSHLPAIYELRDFVDRGGLISYGASLAGMRRQAFGYIKRILQGAKPSELPILQPATFELVVNLKTAQALGITIPDSVLAQATDVIR
jgi:putative ABC transport system substrate-binding protein